MSSFNSQRMQNVVTYTAFSQRKRTPKGKNHKLNFCLSFLPGWNMLMSNETINIIQRIYILFNELLKEKRIHLIKLSKNESILLNYGWNADILSGSILVILNHLTSRWKIACKREINSWKKSYICILKSTWRAGEEWCSRNTWDIHA